MFYFFTLSFGMSLKKANSRSNAIVNNAQTSEAELISMLDIYIYIYIVWWKSIVIDEFLLAKVTKTSRNDDGHMEYLYIQFDYVLSFLQPKHIFFCSTLKRSFEVSTIENSSNNLHMIFRRIGTRQNWIEALFQLGIPWVRREQKKTLSHLQNTHTQIHTNNSQKIFPQRKTCLSLLLLFLLS